MYSLPHVAPLACLARCTHSRAARTRKSPPDRTSASRLLKLFTTAIRANPAHLTTSSLPVLPPSFSTNPSQPHDQRFSLSSLPSHTTTVRPSRLPVLLALRPGHVQYHPHPRRAAAACRVCKADCYRVSSRSASSRARATRERSVSSRPTAPPAPRPSTRLLRTDARGSLSERHVSDAAAGVLARLTDDSCARRQQHAGACALCRGSPGIDQLCGAVVAGALHHRRRQQIANARVQAHECTAPCAQPGAARYPCT
jgi:hypothetical protein